MPLESGSSRAAIAHNIKTEEAAGRSHKQAIAIALNKANESMHKDNSTHRRAEEHGKKLSS